MPAMVARSMVRMAVSGAAQEALQRNGGAFGSLMSRRSAWAAPSTRTRIRGSGARCRRTSRWRAPWCRAAPCRSRSAQGRAASAEVKVDGTYAVVVLRPLGSQLTALVSQPGSGTVAAAPSAPSRPGASRTVRPR